MTFKIGDTIEFNWTWWNKKIIRKGIITKVHERSKGIFGTLGEQYYNVDCSKYQPTHGAFVPEELIISVNGKNLEGKKDGRNNRKI